MNHKRCLLLGVLASIIIFTSYAEDLKISVYDGELEVPLEGAKVFLNEDRSVAVETDMDGNAVLDLGEKFEQGNIVCQFPGYSQNVQHIKSGIGELKVFMTISDFLEGKEIVVARAAQKSEQKSGVSVVMTREQMDTTARSGLVEDVMSSVNTMPGMTFGGQWNSEPSVRGGYPREMSYALDGVYVMFPWHWGGSYSIFSPNFVESTRLNNGVFSAEYGRAVSGLLEVNTVMPDDQLHFILDLNYISTSLFLSSPIGKKAGIVLGAKATYLETLIGTFRAIGAGENTKMLKRPPYIRDFYAKAFFEPTDKLTFTVNGFFGSDGLTIDLAKEDVKTEDDIISYGKMDYDVYQGIAGIDAKWMASDKIQTNLRLAWSLMKEDLMVDFRDAGFIRYNQDFLSLYGNRIPAEDLARGGYDLDTSTEYSEIIRQHLLQGKSDTEIKFNDFNRIKFGGEEVLAFQTTQSKGNMWSEVDLGGEYPLYMPFVFNNKSEGVKSYNTAGFALWNYGNDETLLSGELGLRADHAYLRGDGVDLKSPVNFNPRGTIHVTPWRDVGKIERVVFTAGAGLFSAIPFNAVMVSKDIVIHDKFKMDRALFNVLGVAVDVEDNWKFSLEGYYKHYLNRLYVVNDMRNPANVIAEARMDGKGYTLGFDLMAQKSIGEKWNGYLTYSFIYARYKNPVKPLYPDQTAIGGEPLDQWYYPQFHRFNTLNMIVNYKPKQDWTLTLKGTFATGTPRTDGQKFCYPAQHPNGKTIMQRYSRSHFYSNTLRTDISCPIDVRISHTGTFKNHPKWKWEWYAGAEDIFMNLYSPKGSEQFNQTTGKKESSDVNFSIGIPMISLGCRFSY